MWSYRLVKLVSWDWEVHEGSPTTRLTSWLVASLGWVSRGRQLRVSPLFFLKKMTTFLVITVCQFCGVSPLLLKKNWRPFLLITVNHRHFYWFHSGVTPWNVSPRTFFYLSDLVCPQFFVNLPTIFFPFGCHPLEGFTRAFCPPPPLVTPLQLHGRKEVRFMRCLQRENERVVLYMWWGRLEWRVNESRHVPRCAKTGSHTQL